MTIKFLIYFGIPYFFSTLSVFVLNLNAQAVNLTGSVADKKYNPVESVLVTYVGNEDVLNSSRTDMLGRYTLEWTRIGVESDRDGLPRSLQLEQNYPNPLNPSTTIDFTIPEQGRFIIYNLLGQVVDRLAVPQAGKYSLKWNGVNSRGRSVSAGIYFYSLRTNSKHITKKMVLLDGGNKGNPLFLKGISKSVTLSMVTANDTLKFTHGGITNVFLPITITTDTVINAVVNRGPVFTGNIRDTVLIAGDTLIYNLNSIFYNDDQSDYKPDSLTIDSLFRFIAAKPETLQNVTVYAFDAFDSTLTDSSNKFSIFVGSSPNNPPSVSNVLITPTTPTIGDTLFLSYVYSDPDGDADRSLIEWYRNSQLTGVSGLIFLPDSAAANDTINSIVTPYDGELYGVPVGSNTVVIQPLPTRTLTGTITDYFADAPADNILLISSLDSARTNAQGEFTLEAALAEEHIPILHSSILASGTILPASPNDTSLILYIARGDSANGIDSTYFRDEIVSGRESGPPFPSDGKYVSFTEESINDTVWIGGYIIRPSDSFIISYPFQNVAQLNKIAGIINSEGDTLTNGLFGINSTTIAIADSNFNHPDSIAQFQYSNMVVVPNEMFPAELEPLRNATTIRGDPVLLAFGGTIYEEDEVTIKGITIILKNNLTPELIEHFMREEFVSSLWGGVESDINYPSIIDVNYGILFPHDIRMMNWTHLREPGRIYSDFPAGFDPALIERHAPGVLEKIKVSKNLPVDFSKYHLDKATGSYLRK